MERVYLEDLTPVGVLSDKELFFAKKEDLEDTEKPVFCIRVFCDNTMTYGFGIAQKFFKYLPAEEVDQKDEVLKEYYHDRISKTFNSDAIFKMMSDFKDEYDKMSSLEDGWLYDFTSIKSAQNE